MKQLYIILGRALYWIVWPGSWVYLHRSQRTRLVLMHKDEILVVDNWLGAGKWNLPGGGLHKGEDPQQGLVREIEEETGIRLSYAAITPLREEWIQVHGFRYRCYYFAATCDVKPVTHVQKYEINATSWIKKSEITPKSAGKDVVRGLEILDSTKRL